MKEFNCSRLGYTCTWRHIARTEDLLADVAAIHLRDVHGVQEISPDLLGKLKNAFTSPPEAAVAELADAQVKVYTCDMAPTCSWRYIAMTEELIVDGAAVHAREAHGITEFSPEMIAKVKNATHAWDGDSEKKKAA